MAIQHPPQATVDFDKIAWLREMFKDASKQPEKLYHVTRLVIDPNSPRSTDCSDGWTEFRPEVETFRHASYDRGVTCAQDHCYHGAKNRLLEYRGLAAKAFMQIPGKYYIQMRLYYAKLRKQNVKCDELPA